MLTLLDVHGMGEKMERKLAVVQNQVCSVFFVSTYGQDVFFLASFDARTQNSFPAETTLQSRGGGSGAIHPVVKRRVLHI